MTATGSDGQQEREHAPSWRWVDYPLLVSDGIVYQDPETRFERVCSRCGTGWPCGRAWLTSLITRLRKASSRPNRKEPS